MTRQEAERLTAQEARLLELGFTAIEAEHLRRISQTLQRWHERECGSDSACIVRGRWNHGTDTFDHDDNGAPYEEYAGGGRSRYYRVPDRETEAKRRLTAILAARNGRPVGALGEHVTEQSEGMIRAYIQTDPRGAALYLLRTGDVPAGGHDAAYYTNGICVY